MPQIRVSERTLKALRRFAGWLQMQTGKQHSDDETLIEVLKRVDMTVDMVLIEEEDTKKKLR